MSPGQRQDLMKKADSADNRRTEESRRLMDSAASGVSKKETAASVDFGFVDYYRTGPTGVLEDWVDGASRENAEPADILPGEQLTAYAEVVSTGLSSVEATIVFQDICGANGSADPRTLGTVTVEAPAYGSGAFATASLSYAAPADCPDALGDGLPNYSVAAWADSPDDGGLILNFNWLNDVPLAELVACGCLADSADPGSESADTGDPVDTVSGAFAESATDVSLQSPGYPLTISRSYSSADTDSGPLGPGWSVPWEAGLSVDSSTGNVTFTAEDGDQYVYTPAGTGFDPPPGAQSVLAEVANSSGDVTGYTLTDPSGHVVLTFNAGGVLQSEDDATGQGLTFTYNSSGQVSSITDAAGQSVTLVYEGSLLSEVELPNGQAVSYEYTNGLLTAVDAPGAPSGEWTYYTYNSAGLLATAEDADGNTVVSNTYNSSCQVTSQEDGLGNTTSFSYTPTSDGLSETDVTAPSGGITTYLYDGGMLLEEIGPVDDAITEYSYNNFGEPVSVTDPLGRVTYYGYDGSGDVTSETSDLGYTQEWTYDSNGNVLTSENADGDTTTYTYNSMDEPLTETAPGGQKTQYTYNSDGSMTSEISARGDTTTYTYYSNGMLASVSNPDGGTTSYTCDAMGYPLAVTDALGRVTTYTYNAAEEVASVEAPGGGTTSYGYDGDGDLTSREDPDGNTWTYAYNADGELAKATYPLANSDTYGYDGDGNQTSFTDGRGIVTATAYNAADEPTGVSYSDGTPSVSYEYDADGEVTSVTDGTGTRKLTYDGDGDLTAEGGFSYGYDDAGNITSREYPDGTTTNYAYNDDGQVSSMTVGSAETSYSYDADGNLVSTVEPDQVTESRTYDNADQLTGITDATSSSTLDSYGLTLNADGEPTAVAVTQDGTAQATQYYGYNMAGDLTSACYSTTGASACSAASAGTVPGSASDPSGVTGMVTSGESAMCLDDTSDSGSAGNKIQLWHCLGDDSQDLTATGAGQLQVAGGCLAVSGGGKAAGTGVVLEPCTSGDAAETWQAGSGSTLVNPASGLCLDDPGASTTNGTQADIAACDGSAEQEWALPGSGGGWITDGVTGICSTDDGGSSTAGAKVVIWTCDGIASEQDWSVTASGQWEIHSLCAQATSSATGLVLESCSGATDQQWATGPDGWVLNVGVQDCLSDIGASTTNGTQIVITGCSSNAQQSWRPPPSRINSGVITSGVSGVCANDSAGTKAEIAACDASADEQWQIGNDANIRTQAASAVCWTLDDGDTSSGTSIVLASCGSADQEFAEGPADAPWITSVDGAAAGLCVTDPGGSATAGTQLDIASCSSGSTSQRWALPPTTVPWTPTGVSVTAGTASAAISWTPASEGGDPVTGYTVTASPGGKSATVGPYDTTARVGGLTPGAAYTFTVTAESAAGTSAASAATTAVTSGSETTYAYDAAGNQTGSDSDGVTTTNSYNADEELTQSVTGSTTASYGYDADGNQTSAGGATYTYNGANELTSADAAAGDFTYTYDAEGNLATTSLNGTQIQGTVWDLNNPLPMAAEDTSASGATTADYIYNPAGTLASMGTSTGNYYAVTDWLGSLTGLVSSSGTQVTSTTYSTYGTPSTTDLTSTAPTSSIGYASSYALPGDTGFDDMRARDYNPATATFTSIDPALSQSGQPYLYAGNSPVSATDPSGSLCSGCGEWSLTPEDILEWAGEILSGKNPGQILEEMGGVPSGWEVSPGQGQSVAPGWKMWEIAHPDNQIRWSAGSLRPDHPDDPYWVVSSGASGRSERIPGAEWPDGPSEYTQKQGGDTGGVCTTAYTGAGCDGDDPLFGGEGDEGDDPFLGEPFLMAYLLGDC
jgi:RHS repeat-associated protein